MTMPFITVLLALKQGMEARFAGREFNGKAVKVRHARHRDTRRDEWPAISIVYVSSDPSQSTGRGETDDNLPEEVMELAVNLRIDMELPPEADEYSVDDPDPTGFGWHAAVMQWALDWLIPGDDKPDNTLGGTAWTIRYDGTAPDESEASPDEARLEERLTIFYRVRRDQPTILLTGS